MGSFSAESGGHFLLENCPFGLSVQLLKFGLILFLIPNVSQRFRIFYNYGCWKSNVRGAMVILLLSKSFGILYSVIFIVIGWPGNIFSNIITSII